MDDKGLLKGCSIRLHGLNDNQYEQIMQLMGKARHDERQKLEAENARWKARWEKFETDLMVMLKKAKESQISDSENYNHCSDWEQTNQWHHGRIVGISKIINMMHDLESGGSEVKR